MKPGGESNGLAQTASGDVSPEEEENKPPTSVEDAVERFRELLVRGELDADGLDEMVAHLEEGQRPAEQDGPRYQPDDLVRLFLGLDQVFVGTNATTRYVYRSLCETLRLFFRCKYVEGFSLRGRSLVYEHTTIPDWLLSLALRITGVDSLVGREIPLFDGSSFKDLIDTCEPRELTDMEDRRLWLQDFLDPSVPENVENRERYAKLIMRMLGIHYVYLVPLVASGRVVGILSFQADRPMPKRARTDIILLSSRIAHLITAKKREEERLGVISDGVASIEVVQDEEGQAIRDFVVRDANRAFLDFFDTDREAVVDGSLRNLGEELQSVYRDLTKVFFTNIPSSLELTFPSRRRICELVISRAEYDDLILVVHDVTRERHAREEQERLAAKMRQAQRLGSLGVLAGGIAHDFNNLLMSILANTELAMLEVTSDSAVMESLEDIQISARLGAELTDELLAFAGESRYVVEPIDLNQVIKESTGLIRVSLSKKVRFELDLAEEVPPIAADVSQVRQVVVNLVTNASEALEDQPGVVTLRTGTMFCDQASMRHANLLNELPNGEYVFVSVADTGCGMDEVTLQKVLDPFFSTKEAGRGLGLASVAGIVQGHGGTLQIESKVMQGSVVTLLFPPFSDRPSWIPPPVGQRRERAAPRTVLLVDDEPEIRIAGRHLLERCGFSVIVACDGRQAVEVFRDRRDEVDCVILDLMMPEMNGRETFHHLRRIDPSVPVILSSGYSQRAAVRDLLSQGLAGFIQKPYQLVEFKAKLRDVFEGD